MLAIYIRLSKEDDKSNSIENQEREGVQFAQKNSFPYKVYNEGQGLSGTLGIENRPELESLTKDIIKGDIDAFWVRNQNRLERDGMTFQLFIKIARKHNVRVFYGEKEMDIYDPAIMFQNTIFSALNQYQAELQSYQTKKSLLDNIKAGKASGRILPYGYKSDEKGILVIDEEEAEIVKRIFAMSLEGKGQKTIANWLNDNDIPTRYNKFSGTITTKNKYTGKPTTRDKKDIRWSDKVPYDIITNPIYKGERRWKTKTYPAPAILTPDYWLKVNDNLKNNRSNTGKKVDHKYLLKGLLRCAKCGKNYYGRSKTNDPKGFILRVSKSGRKRLDYNVYMCASKRYSHTNCGSKSLRLIELDALIWGVFFKEQALLNKVKDHFQNFDVNKQEKEAKEKAEDLISKIKEINNQKQNAINLVIKGIASEEDLKPQLGSINFKLTDLNEQLSSTRSYLKSIESSSTTLSKKIDVLSKLKSGIDFKDKRDIIHSYIEDIVIYTHFNDPTDSFVQINVHYRDNLLTTDKFIFNLKQGIAINIFNGKVISLYHSINEENLLEDIKPFITEIKKQNNVQK